jgi:chromosome segregation ATPase
MRWSNGFSFRLLLCLALLFAGSSLSFPQETEPKQPLPQQTQSISQLKDNLTQALALCQTLKENLDLRIASFQSLKDSYDKLLVIQQALQQSLNDSEKQLQMAQADLQAMKDLSVSLRTSLQKASKSLADYKSETDKAVRALEIQRNGWKIAGITFGVATVVGIVYITVKKAW